MTPKSSLSALITQVLVVCVFLSATTSALVADEIRYDWGTARELSPGIRYTRYEKSDPRMIVANCLRIDLKTRGLKFRTTPRRGEWVEGKAETNRQTVRNFIRRSQMTDRKLVVAVNGDSFAPWPAPFDREDPTDVGGLAVADGEMVSRPAGTPSLVVRKSGKVTIETVTMDQDLSDIETAISGFELCLAKGEVPPSGEDLNPRTGFGLSQDAQFLYLLAIDGRQPASAGATIGDVGRLLKEFGSHMGINMDGGGSTTMAWWDASTSGEDKCKLLSSPVGSGKTYDPAKTKEPFATSERANGNNFGVYYATN